jgi:hypothetical protein
MKLAELYRAARRNLWRLHYRTTQAVWTGTPNYNAHSEARWAHTSLARQRVTYYVSLAKHKVTASEINKVLAAHWMEFSPRTRCISRMLRDLLEPKDRHVLKSA